MRLGVAGIEGDGPLEMFDGFLSAAEALESHADVVVSWRICGRKPQCALEAGQRFLRLIEPQQRLAPTSVSDDEVGLQRHGPLVGAHGLRVVAHLVQGVAEIGVHVRVRRPHAHRCADQIHGFLRMPQLAKRDAEKMQGVAIAWLTGEYLTELRGRLCEAALALQRVALRQLGAVAAPVHRRNVSRWAITSRLRCALTARA